MLRLALNSCQQSPDGSPSDLAVQESHETEESSSPSRRNLVKLFRQHYSPAPLGTSFSGLHAVARGAPSHYAQRGVWPANSPRYLL